MASEVTPLIFSGLFLERANGALHSQPIPGKLPPQISNHPTHMSFVANQFFPSLGLTLLMRSTFLQIPLACGLRLEVRRSPKLSQMLLPLPRL